MTKLEVVYLVDSDLYSNVAFHYTKCLDLYFNISKPAGTYLYHLLQFANMGLKRFSV
jgi:hypothetical protein